MTRLLPIPSLSRPIGTAMLLAALCLAGCGQKGPLYLPDEEPNAAPSESDATPTANDPT